VLVQLRISLPDRPGALGQASRATGTLGVDIVSVQVLSRASGRALDDLYLSVPSRQRIATIVAELQTVQGLQIHGVRESANLPGAHPDLDLIGYVIGNPSRGVQTLTDMAPVVFATDWAALQHRRRPASATLYASTGTPKQLPPLTPTPHRTTRHDAGDMKLAVTPLGEQGLTLVLGRHDGPAFHPIELDHIRAVVEIVLAAGALTSPEDVAPHVTAG